MTNGYRLYYLFLEQKDYEILRLEQNDNGFNEYEKIEDIDLSIDNYIIEQEELFYGNN